ncbi:MAG: MarC family protein [Oceanospirillaceae bacterium]|nr:MarC family protein [Oceanospirillaceae bacterium]
MDLSIYFAGLASLMVIVDPIGTALVFHSLVPPDDKKFRLKMAFKSVLIATSLLLLFGLYGEPFLNMLGVSIHAFRISGGILLFFTAFNLITQEISMVSSNGNSDISVYPMAIPMMAGPGSLTLAILLFSQSEKAEADIAVAAAILTITLATLCCMLLSRYIKRVIGRTGDDILRRFLGVILAALAIQFIYDGIVNITAG